MALNQSHERKFYNVILVMSAKPNGLVYFTANFRVEPVKVV